MVTYVINVGGEQGFRTAKRLFMDLKKTSENQITVKISWYKFNQVVIFQFNTNYYCFDRHFELLEINITLTCWKISKKIFSLAIVMLVCKTRELERKPKQNRKKTLTKNIRRSASSWNSSWMKMRKTKIA